MIERIRLTSSARFQLVSLKKSTGIEHYNILCRHALFLSLAHFTNPPIENYNFSNGLEMDFKTLTGGNDTLYLNIIKFRAVRDGIGLDEQSVKEYLIRHIHRGISYLINLKNGSEQDFIANNIIIKH